MPKCPPLGGQAIYWANIFLPFLPSWEPTQPTFSVKRQFCYTGRPKCGNSHIVISYNKLQICLSRSSGKQITLLSSFNHKQAIGQNFARQANFEHSKILSQQDFYQVDRVQSRQVCEWRGRVLKDLPILMTLPGMDLAALTCYEHKRRCLVNSRVATSFKAGIFGKFEHRSQLEKRADVADAPELFFKIVVLIFCFCTCKTRFECLFQ